MKWLGRVAKAGHKVHPIDQPVYDIMAQSQPLFYAMRKVEKETESLRMKIKFLMNLCRHKQTRWDPSDPSYKKRNERRDALLQVTELFGWHDRMNLLCLY